MKKTLTLFGLVASLFSFSQITITTNLPGTMAAGSTVDAEVKISKGTVGNFAKYQMDVPAGYVVAAGDVKGGNFTFENQRAKIVWVSVPAEPEFSLTLKISPSSNATNGTFSQKFYYLENNEKKEVDGNSVNVTIGDPSNTMAMSGDTKPADMSQPVGSDSKPSGSSSTPVETVKSVPVETVKSVPVETVKSTSVETPVARNSSAPVAGMTYKVQLGAYSTQPSKGKFAGLSNVSIDQVNGLYKVTCGNFKTKEDAIRYRDELSAKGFSGFIVKYQNGQRVN